MSIDLAVLKTEITTNGAGSTPPATIDYAGAADTFAQEVLINAPGSAVGTIKRTTVTVKELQELVVGSELVVLEAQKQNAWIALLVASTGGEVDLSNAEISGQITAIWAGTTTLTNLTGRQSKPQRDATRAEELFGEGVYCPARKIKEALS